MTEKKHPFGALGNPYGKSVPDDVLSFFGADAPDEQPAIRWTEEQEKAALESERQAEVARQEAEVARQKAELARQAEAARQAELEAIALEEARRLKTQADVERKSQPDAVVSRTTMVTPGESVSAKPAEPKTFGQTIRSHWDSLIDTLGIGGKTKAERHRSRDESEVRRPTSRTVEESHGSMGRSDQREAVAPPNLPSSATPSSVGAKSDSASIEIPPDAFGFGIFSNPKTTPQANPLDSLFEADRPDKQPEVVDSRRRPSRASRPKPPIVEVEEPEVSEPLASDNEVEFEVVDLAGDDISDLWEGESSPRGVPVRKPQVRQPQVREPQVTEPRARGARTGESRVGDPGSGGNQRGRREKETPVGHVGRPEKPAAGRPRPKPPVADRDPVELDGLEESPSRGDGRRVSQTQERRTGRSAKAVGPAPGHEPVPVPADDDDGYTFDNSWVPDDPRDVDAPKRRPVPTWRRVVDHIVDRNLGNRRGGDGRRRSGGPPRAGQAEQSRAVAATPRGRRENVPTYLDVPADDFEDKLDDGPSTSIPSRSGRRPSSGVSSDEWRSDQGRTPDRGRTSDRGRNPGRAPTEGLERGRSVDHGRSAEQFDEFPSERPGDARRPRSNSDYRDLPGRDSSERERTARRPTSDRNPIGERIPSREHELIDDLDPPPAPPRRRRPPSDDGPSGGSSGRGRRRY